MPRRYEVRSPRGAAASRQKALKEAPLPAAGDRPAGGRQRGHRRPGAQRPRRRAGQHRADRPPGDRRARPATHAGPAHRPHLPRRRRDAGPGPVHRRRAHSAGGRAAHPAARRLPGPVPPPRDGVRRRSHGVLLKGPDVPEVVEAGQRLVAAGIPVVTLVTDVPASGRLAYVGIDNRAAGATAAYLIGQWLGDAPGDVLVTLSRSVFRGEEERQMGFRATLRDRALVVVPDTDGLDATPVTAALAAHPGIRAVYSAGGGNAAILDAFGGRECRVFVAHDLDADNVALLRAGRISAVLHHDLGQDMRRACHVIMQAHRALPGGILSWPSSIQVVTPFNAPQPPPPEHR